jgi:dTDP-4-dehydrorhamnose reductase
MNLKILVTGSNGQLGNEIKEIARFKTEYDFIFTDVDNLDIANVEQLTDIFEEYVPNFVINCAAYTAVDTAETDIDNAFKINSAAVSNLSVICQKHQIPIIHISTDYVFDGQNYRPYTEKDETNPQNVYGKSKMEGEEALKGYEKSIILRTSWLYSAYGNNFVKTIMKLIGEKPLISVFLTK